MPGKKRSQKPSKPAAKLVKGLAHRGPHQVLAGSLGIVGMDGQVFAPSEGTGLPAIAFGHAWLADTGRYRDLLYHFASWGFVVAAPNGQRGMFASDVGLAAEMRSALSVITHALLGDGKVTVNPVLTGYAGHGFGASAAVIAGSQDVVLGQSPTDIRGVAAAFPAPTTSVLLPAARQVTAPGLILAAGTELDTVDANARPLASAYGGDVVLRTLPAAGSRGLIERRSIKSLIGINGADKTTHAQVRALMTGFLLYTVAGDDTYAGFADAEAVIAKTLVTDPERVPEGELDQISRLLGAKPRKKRGKASQEIPVP